MTLVLSSLPQSVPHEHTHTCTTRPELPNHLSLTELISQEHALVDFKQYRQRNAQLNFLLPWQHTISPNILQNAQQPVHPANPSWSH